MDLFDYIKVPTKKEFRKENIVDDIHRLPQLKNIQRAYFTHPSVYLVQDAIINYNNEIVVLKMYYAYAQKYYKYYKKNQKNEYDFWCRKYMEQIIKEIYSIYDKSLHVINYIYDFKVLSNLDFKKNIRSKLKEVDKPRYRKINKIYSKLYGSKNNELRDDITHNFSDAFYKYAPKYYEDKETGWELKEPLSLEELFEVIDTNIALLKENKILLEELIKEKYPPPLKGSELMCLMKNN